MRRSVNETMLQLSSSHALTPDAHGWRARDVTVYAVQLPAFDRPRHPFLIWASHQSSTNVLLCAGGGAHKLSVEWVLPFRKANEDKTLSSPRDYQALYAKLDSISRRKKERRMEAGPNRCWPYSRWNISIVRQNGSLNVQIIWHARWLTLLYDPKHAIQVVSLRRVLAIPLQHFNTRGR